MRYFLLNTLHFTRRERYGAIFLTLVCVFVFVVPELIRCYFPRKTTDFSEFRSEIQAFRQAMENAGPTPTPGSAELFFFDPNTATLEDFGHLGLSEKVAGTICRYREKGGRFREATDLQKIWSLSREDFERLLPYVRIGSPKTQPVNASAPVAVLFPFDPNTAGEQDLLRLGLSPKTVKSILNYRNKGGAFKNKESFRKIYTLGEAEYRRLEPYVTIEQIAQAPPARPVAYSGSTGSASTRVQAVDINRAGPEEWQSLPGIGEKRALQVLKFRESLGGFVSVKQVGEMYGLPDSIFQRIEPFLSFSGGIRKIDLNTATAEDLDRHPYISEKQARLIVAYRDQHGPFASVEDLGKSAALTDKKWLEKIKPYLDVR